MSVAVFRAWRGLPPAARGAAVALGNFDGVHLGHQAVLDAARTDRLALACLTFEPHPRAFFRPEDPPFRLTLAPERLAALAEHGVACVYELPFDAALSRMPAEEFVREVLVGGLGVARVACGEDFVFGHRRGGNVALLRALGAALGFAVALAAPVMAADGTVVSSSAVRDALALGDIVRARALLGRHPTLAGDVAHGDKRGRTIGFPTANIVLGAQQEPRRGVYAVTAMIDGRRVPGVANVGVRPTVGGAPSPRLEAHFFDLSADLYGQRLVVALHEFLRPERKFPDFAALKAQIEADAAQARALLDAAPPAA